MGSPSPRKQRQGASLSPRKRSRTSTLLYLLGSTRALLFFLALGGAGFLLLNLWLYAQLLEPPDGPHVDNLSLLRGLRNRNEEKCAILFFGLPRAFSALVLPSILQNVLEPNACLGCDIFVHYFHVEQELKGRRNPGGTIDPRQIELLPEAVKQIQCHDDGTTATFRVVMEYDTEESFVQARNATLDKYHNTWKDGRRVYFPWKSKSYQFPTTLDNVVRQWHSIERVWHMMERQARQSRTSYNWVAMLRLDVLYVTPIALPPPQDRSNVALIPGFAMYPANDRMMMGTYPAVKVWATQRFSLAEEHVRHAEHKGWGIHPERLLNQTLFPKILQMGTKLVHDPKTCFFRVRADGSVFSADCHGNWGSIDAIERADRHHLVEELTGLKCPQIMVPDWWDYGKRGKQINRTGKYAIEAEVQQCQLPVT